MDQERRIDQEIAEEFEKHRMERELGGMDEGEDSEGEFRLPEGMNSEDFEVSERQILQMAANSSSNIIAGNASINNRDTSMISASGASSG